MKLLLSISFLFISFNIFGQEVKIDTIKIELSDKLTSGFEENNYYPLIKTENKEIDSLINYDLKNKVTQEERPSKNIDSTLNEWASNGLVLLDFQINYNKNGILSLRIDAESCGAYCTSWTEYYNYSIVTGKALELSDIVDLTNLKDDIIKKKNKQYQINREELKKQLDEDEGLDLSTYQFVLERYNECNNSFEINQFALYEDHLEIIEECYLPHAFKPSTPIIDIQYKLSDIKEHLKIKN